jgi:transaldolase
MSTALPQLAEHGQSVWIDFLSRELLRGGDLARLMREDAVSWVTSNPTIFQKAISAGDAYDDQLRDLFEVENDPKEIFITHASKDVRDVCDSSAQSGTRAAAAGTAASPSKSTPISPHDTEASIAEAQRLHEKIDRRNPTSRSRRPRAGCPRWRR